MPEKTLVDYRVGIVGAGNMAHSYIDALGHFNLNSPISILARSSYRRSELQVNHSEIEFYSNIEDFMNCELDLVIIAVAEDAVLELFEYLSNNFKNFLVEKPAGVNYEETKRICDLAKLKNLDVRIALNRRFYNSTEILMKSIANCPNGKIIIVNDQQDVIDGMKLNRNNKVIDNWHFANSVHLLDLGIYFANGNVSNIQTTKNISLEKKGFVNSVITFDNGDTLIYNAIWGMPARWKINIYNPESHFEMYPIESLRKQKYGTRSFEELSKVTDEGNFKPGLINMLSEYLKRAEIRLIPSIGEYLETVRIIKNIYD